MPVSPTVGYRTPKDIRGLHPSGYEAVRVCNVDDIAKLKPKYHAAMISSKVGRRKRITLVDELEARGIKILNKGYEEEIPIEIGEVSDVDLGLVDIEEQEAALDDIELTDEDLDDVDEESDFVSYSREDLENMTVSDLKDICRENDVKGYSKLKKNEIIDLICEEMEEDEE